MHFILQKYIGELLSTRDFLFGCEHGDFIGCKQGDFRYVVQTIV